MKLPQARRRDIVMQDLGDEILIYDLITNKACQLNETSSRVFRACNGETTLADLTKSGRLDDEVVFFALDELRRNNLLADGETYSSPFAGMNRRAVIKKVGLASAAALPLILGITAPKAVNASSGAVACVLGASCSCSVPNNTGDGALCGGELGGTSVNCGSSVPDDGCDCFIPDGGANGSCAIPL